MIKKTEQQRAREFGVSVRELREVEGRLRAMPMHRFLEAIFGPNGAVYDPASREPPRSQPYLNYLYTPLWRAGTGSAMEKQKRKRKIGNRPETTERYKKRFIETLEKGYSPRYAAKLANVSRPTIYNWKRDDPEFAAAWDDAILTGVDLVESRLVQRAIKNSDSNAQFYLRAHKPEIYGRHDT